MLMNIRSSSSPIWNTGTIVRMWKTALLDHVALGTHVTYFVV